jgi:mannose-6-phosphate isomerase-like protein (cupin superfamily)
MYRIRVDELPVVGMSRVFVGAERGDVGISSYLVHAPPGKGPPLHFHPYDKVAFVQAGRVRWTVSGEDFEAGPGEILVVKAGEIHRFRSVGNEPLVQLDVHLGPRFIQTNVE